MNKSEYDVLSVVDEKTALGRALWILGTFISILLLIFSFLFESAVLVLFDALIPLVFILYVYISKKEFPIYHYLICSCGSYSFIWFIWLSPDLSSESALQDGNLLIEIAIIIVGLFSLFVVFEIVFFIFRKLNSIKYAINRDKSNKFFHNILTASILIFVLLGTTFCSVNVLLDKPYKENWVYVTHIEYGGRGASCTIYYKRALNQEATYSINSHFHYETSYESANGEPMAKIEYGKGAFGLEWRRIIE